MTSGRTGDGIRPGGKPNTQPSSGVNLSRRALFTHVCVSCGKKRELNNEGFCYWCVAARNTIKDKIEQLRPVEIVGDHWIHREVDDPDAKFYRRDEVDAILERLRE